MLDRQIFIGFSDIKTELRKRARIFKEMQNLRLWFSLEHGIIYAHDYQEHSKCIIIAIHTSLPRTSSLSTPSSRTTSADWSIQLDPKSMGHMLVQDVVSTVPYNKIIIEFNRRYVKHGHFI